MIISSPFLGGGCRVLMSKLKASTQSPLVDAPHDIEILQAIGYRLVGVEIPVMNDGSVGRREEGAAAIYLFIHPLSQLYLGKASENIKLFQEPIQEVFQVKISQLLPDSQYCKNQGNLHKVPQPTHSQQVFFSQRNNISFANPMEGGVAFEPYYFAFYVSLSCQRANLDNFLRF